MTPDFDDLFDGYLDACLAGGREDPAVFCARHGVDDAELIARLTAVRALHRTPPEDVEGDRRTDAGAPAGLPFERLGEFRLLTRLDEGGMGSVFLARQESLGREVALKILRPELRDSPSAEERFRREAQAVARLRHPNIVAVHAVGDDRGVRFIAMELVSGRTLAEVVAEASSAGRTLPVAGVLNWGAELARALQCAHDAGIVHRDVKPANVRITSDARAMLLDFGIARDANATGPSLTATFAGSPLYAAPEQLCGAQIDARADVYALGVTLYQALTGRVPFAGDSMEAVLARVLVESPVAVRRLNPAVSRDAETVIAKAMEKEPERRYRTAAEFAEDLEAAGAGRPVRARPASRWRLASNWIRSHAVFAAVIATLLAATGTAIGIAVLDRRREAARRRERAEATIGDARSRLAALARLESAAPHVEETVAEMRVSARSRHLSAEEETKLREQEDGALALRRERETTVYEVLELLRSADQLDPDRAAETDAIRADVYVQKWREARAAREMPAAEFWRARAERFDATGRLAAVLRPRHPQSIASVPPGAEVHLFRYRELADLTPGGEHRLVPVPWRGAASPPAGSWALRAERGGGTVVSGDHVVAVDGRPVDAATDVSVARAGSPVTVLRDGVEREAVLGPGALLRLTAAPAAPCRASFAGIAPLVGLPIEEGDYLALLRLDGHEIARVAIAVPAADTSTALTVRLAREGALPEGFVTVGGVAGVARVAVAQCEVTCAEYLEFLNDPAVRSRIDASPEPILFPRSPDNRRDGGYWPRGDDGAYRLADRWDPRWPVLGVSFDDATAYAAWRTELARAAGRTETFRLPRVAEWAHAAGGHLAREFPFGDRFSARWTKSCFSREAASPEPVLSFPADESPYGVFDMAGGATEWAEAWFDEARGSRRLCGSSWAQAEPLLFRIWAAGGLAPSSSTGETGIRLVADIPELVR